MWQIISCNSKTAYALVEQCGPGVLRVYKHQKSITNMFRSQLILSCAI